MADPVVLRDELTGRLDRIAAYRPRSVEMGWHPDDDDLAEDDRRWYVQLVDATGRRRRTAYRRGIAGGVLDGLDEALAHARRAWWRRTRSHLERVLPQARRASTPVHVRLVVADAGDFPDDMPVTPVGIDLMPGGRRGHLFTVADAEQLLTHAKEAARG